MTLKQKIPLAFLNRKPRRYVWQRPWEDYDIHWVIILQNNVSLNDSELHLELYIQLKFKRNEYVNFFYLPTIRQGIYHDIFGLTSTRPPNLHAKTTDFPKKNLPTWVEEWRFPKAEISTIPKNVFWSLKRAMWQCVSFTTCFLFIYFWEPLNLCGVGLCTATCLWICRPKSQGELTLWHLQSMVSDTFDFLKATPVFSQMEAWSHQPTCHMMKFLSNEVNLCVCFWWLVRLWRWSAWEIQTELLLSKPCPGNRWFLWNRFRTNQKSEQTLRLSFFFSGKNTRHVNRYVSELVEVFQRIVCFSVFLAGMLQLRKFSYSIAHWFSFLWDQLGTPLEQLLICGVPTKKGKSTNTSGSNMSGAMNEKSILFFLLYVFLRHTLIRNKNPQLPWAIT